MYSLKNTYVFLFITTPRRTRQDGKPSNLLYIRPQWFAEIKWRLHLLFDPLFNHRINSLAKSC